MNGWSEIEVELPMDALVLRVRLPMLVQRMVLILEGKPEHETHR